ncbi:MAG: hypothetical protein M3N98_08190, partial [Actinomycetota bacterium]|nr:hypothetical protein [Actinomycetota bacterium]
MDSVAVGPRLTAGLVLAAAATLVVGFFTRSPWLIYLSIGCSAAAAVVLRVWTSRRRVKAEAQPAGDLAWAASLAEPADARQQGVGPQPVRGGIPEAGRRLVEVDTDTEPEPETKPVPVATARRRSALVEPEAPEPEFDLEAEPVPQRTARGRQPARPAPEREASPAMTGARSRP